jgi:hypothetical protein
VRSLRPKNNDCKIKMQIRGRVVVAGNGNEIVAFLLPLVGLNCGLWPESFVSFKN